MAASIPLDVQSHMRSGGHYIATGSKKRETISTGMDVPVQHLLPDFFVGLEGFALWGYL